MVDAAAAANTSKESAGADGGGVDPTGGGIAGPEQGHAERRQGGPSGSRAA